MRRIPGVDFSSGSLGHGLSVGVGMAQAARLRGYDETRIWVLLGDQELNEGQIWEAAGAPPTSASATSARSSTPTRWGSTG